MNYMDRFLVWITHIPSGIKTRANGYRSQFRNRESAWLRLKSILWAKEKGIEPKKDVIFTYDLDRFSEDEMFDKRREIK